MKLTSGQARRLGELAGRYAVLDVEIVGPLLQVKVWVQSASSSGYTAWYYNRDGKKVDV